MKTPLLKPKHVTDTQKIYWDRQDANANVKEPHENKQLENKYFENSAEESRCHDLAAIGTSGSQGNSGTASSHLSPTVPSSHNPEFRSASNQRQYSSLPVSPSSHGICDPSRAVLSSPSLGLDTLRSMPLHAPPASPQAQQPYLDAYGIARESPVASALSRSTPYPGSKRQLQYNEADTIDNNVMHLLKKMRVDQEQHAHPQAHGHSSQSLQVCGDDGMAENSKPVVSAEAINFADDDDVKDDQTESQPTRSAWAFFGKSEEARLLDGTAWVNDEIICALLRTIMLLAFHQISRESFIRISVRVFSSNTLPPGSDML